VTTQQIACHPLLEQQWYHSIELAPGVFTRGWGFENIILTRLLLWSCPAEAAVCLDIGAMEGLVSFLLERRGAARVISYDRNNKPSAPVSNGDRFLYARAALGSAVEQVYDIPLAELRRRCALLGARSST